ncbi:nickel-binding protein [Nitriliruptor alkaliphilus]|uniref:nickel-binding protein n=1 Tax=Nitriliruptor alkaliphilus TaxID=427918 RepID=UPI000696034B|nr:nickel-binding protein [Nitriliruptor alkaliphilus]
MTTRPFRLYAISRRRGWTPEELEAADARSNAEAARRPEQLRKIRSYLLAEPDGSLGSICLYEAVGPEVLEEHARAAELPCDDIVEVTAIDVHRPDPDLTAVPAG